MRIGHGYDVHRLVPGRKLILGGVEIPHYLGLLGHSDADVVTHALMDALLGAAALGDIGQHFPDSDPEYLGVSSLTLLGRVVDLLAKEGWRLGNADLTILAQRPKLKDYIPQMRQNLARTMGVPVSAVSVKATTEEGLGFTGTEQGIAAHGEDMEAAHDAGLSYGKYQAFLALQALDPSVTAEEVQGMTMREIRDRIAALGGDLEATGHTESSGHHGNGNGGNGNGVGSSSNGSGQGGGSGGHGHGSHD